MKIHTQIYTLFVWFAFCTSCRGQAKTDFQKENIKSETESLVSSAGPSHITRNVIQDKRGNIWIASWDGIFRYDGKLFINITNKVSSSHFFSILEDRKGNFWFGSIGSGVYYYDGKSFRNFTTKEGLGGNDVTSIFEDKNSNIWFGTESGVSRYDGKSFQNYMLNGVVNSIIEDKIGRFWFGTTGDTFVYNGKKFTVFSNNSKPFTNVRSVIEDKKGNIWLGGKDGLWRYNGNTFTNITRNFVGEIYEDKEGNIWTGSEADPGENLALSPFEEKSLSGSVIANSQMVLSCYDEKSLSNKTPTVTEIRPKEAGMICGILEAFDGSIWFGTSKGLRHYNRNTKSLF